MLGVWFGLAMACRQVSRHSGAVLHHPTHQIQLGILRHRLVHRDRDVPGPHRCGCGAAGRPRCRPPSAPRRCCRRARAGGRSAAGRIPATAPGRSRQQHHHAAQRQVHQVRPLPPRPRPGVAERRDAGADQAREALAHRRRVQAQLAAQGAARAVEQHVGAGDQAQRRVPPLRPVQVEHDGALAAVVVPEEQRAFGVRHVAVERPDAARGAPPRRLDLDHLGAQSGEQQAGVFAQLVRYLDHPHAVQHARTGGAQHGPIAASPSAIKRPRPAAALPHAMPASLPRVLHNAFFRPGNRDCRVLSSVGYTGHARAGELTNKMHSARLPVGDVEDQQCTPEPIAPLPPP